MQTPAHGIANAQLVDLQNRSALTGRTGPLSRMGRYGKRRLAAQLIPANAADLVSLFHLDQLGIVLPA
jgi:hypothetical protein